MKSIGRWPSETRFAVVPYFDYIGQTATWLTSSERCLALKRGGQRQGALFNTSHGERRQESLVVCTKLLLQTSLYLNAQGQNKRKQEEENVSSNSYVQKTMEKTGCFNTSDSDMNLFSQLLHETPAIKGKSTLNHQGYYSIVVCRVLPTLSVRINNYVAGF